MLIKHVLALSFSMHGQCINQLINLLHSQQSTAAWAVRLILILSLNNSTWLDHQNVLGL